MLLLVLLRAGAGDHTPSHLYIHVGTEVEGVLVVNQNGLLGCKSKKMTVIRLLVRSHKNQAQTLTLNNSNEAKATDSLAEISHKCGSLVSTIKTIEQLW